MRQVQRARRTSLQHEKEGIPVPPTLFVCPLTRKRMHDPVLCEDGVTYERWAILDWLNSHDFFPVSQQRAVSFAITFHHERKEQINLWVETQTRREPALFSHFVKERAEYLYDVGKYYERLASDEFDDSPHLDTAFQYFAYAAARGHAGALFCIGQYYYYAYGKLQKNDEKAFAYFQKSAEKGNIGAMFQLAVFYGKGIGIRRDGFEEVRLLKRLVYNHNYAPAQCALGIKHIVGSEGVSKNEKLALALFEKAAMQGQPEAQHNLGIMCLQGRAGLHSDASRALALLKQATENGHVDSMFLLGSLYERGYKTMLVPDKENALHYYEMASRHGRPDAIERIWHIRHMPDNIECK